MREFRTIALRVLCHGLCCLTADSSPYNTQQIQSWPKCPRFDEKIRRKSNSSLTPMQKFRIHLSAFRPKRELHKSLFSGSAKTHPPMNGPVNQFLLCSSFSGVVTVRAKRKPQRRKSRSHRKRLFLRCTHIPTCRARCFLPGARRKTIQKCRGYTTHTAPDALQSSSILLSARPQMGKPLARPNHKLHLHMLSV
jgi:hypothetical protein